MEQRIRREYTAQTKADAVGQVLKAGLPRRQVARTFDMPEHTLDNWVRKARKIGTHADPSAPAKAGITEQETEISRLKAQCARLTTE